jgi:hypothetical protein
MDFDFRFRNEHGKWESAGHRRGTDREAAFQALAEKTDGGMPAGRYMSRPRTRQKDWDLFVLDRDGRIVQTDEPDPGS